MFHVTIMEEVAAGQQSDRLQKAEAARLFKETRLSNAKRGTRYLRSTRAFVNRLRLNDKGRIIVSKTGLLTQEC